MINISYVFIILYFIEALAPIMKSLLDTYNYFFTICSTEQSILVPDPYFLSHHSFIVHFNTDSANSPLFFNRYFS